MRIQLGLTVVVVAVVLGICILVGGLPDTHSGSTPSPEGVLAGPAIAENSADGNADTQPVIVGCSLQAQPTAQSTPNQSGDAQVAGPSQPAAPVAGLNAIRLPWRDDDVDEWKLKRYFCPGDFNRDDKIDQLDVDMFMQTWCSGEGVLAQFLDVNGDGEVDFNDVDAFINAYEAGDCDPAKTAENRAMVC